MEKYVLILGAGLMQRPSFEAAVQLGYKTLVVDGNPNAVVATHADRFEPIDLKDTNKIVELALSLKEQIAGVFTAGTDFSAAVSAVAEALGLPGHSLEAAKNASNKQSMRECFKNAGVPSPDFSIVSRNEITSFLSDFPSDSNAFPKVVKPVDNMGARGCRLVRSKDEFIGALEEAIRYSRSSRAIVEDYMDGDEYSIDAIVYKDSLTITGFADRHIFYKPYFIEMGHTLPSSAPENVKNELFAVFARGVKALGLTHGAAKADIKFTKNGPMVGEIAARLSGGYMSGWTYPYASGTDLTKIALTLAVGKEPEELLQRRVPLPISDTPFSMYELAPVRFSAERAYISIPGQIRQIRWQDKMLASPFVRDLYARVREGDCVDFPRNNVEKCGNVITFATESKIASTAAEDAVSQVVLRLDTNNAETEKFLECKTKRGEEGFPPSAYSLSPEQKEKITLCFKKMGLIAENEKVLSLVPQDLYKELSEIKDWNHRSLLSALKTFDELCPEHVELDSLAFLNDLLRGGIQGVLYLADSADEEMRQGK